MNDCLKIILLVFGLEIIIDSSNGDLEPLTNTCNTTQYGCCPDGLHEAQGENYLGCVDTLKPSEICVQRRDAGPCRNFEVNWYFDVEYGGCTRFWYGGCKGNSNRFQTRDECQETCVQPQGKASCYLPQIQGPCQGSYPSWSFNSSIGQCVKFTYKGCLGNNNRFATLQQCESTCIHGNYSKPITESPIEDVQTTTSDQQISADSTPSPSPSPTITPDPTTKSPIEDVQTTTLDQQIFAASTPSQSSPTTITPEPTTKSPTESAKTTPPDQQISADSTPSPSPSATITPDPTTESPIEDVQTTTPDQQIFAASTPSQSSPTTITPEPTNESTTESPTESVQTTTPDQQIFADSTLLSSPSTTITPGTHSSILIHRPEQLPGQLILGYEKHQPMIIFPEPTTKSPTESAKTTPPDQQISADSTPPSSPSTTITPDIVVNPTCTDNALLNCKTIAKSNYCGYKTYRKFCCYSCALHLKKAPSIDNFLSKVFLMQQTFKISFKIEHSHNEILINS